ncbi:uncharacterized protein LOC121894316 [Thunnus maccoyii]|uniref:uncharacterized protein LOC121894316 n=1 Tax=Thunnus maccoyii TaxID=8240 RepID=UPI001C4C21C2|nr:uncharacterized protein LOC121894316 [Thunnus maccoyii]
MEAEFEERLCEEVRRYPHLYNSSFKQHKDSQMCNTSWREIAQSLGKEEAMCRQKWKYLKIQFVKAKKKLKGRSGAAGGSVSVPPIVSLLNWLSIFVKHRDTDSNFPIEADEGGDTVTLLLESIDAGGDAQEYSSTSPRTSTPSPPTVTLPPVTPTPPPPPPTSPSSLSSSSSAATSVLFSPAMSRKRKAPSTPVEDAILQRLQEIRHARDNQREEHHFVMMVADMLAKLPTRERMEALFEIHQLLYWKQREVLEKDLSQ